MLDIPAGAYSSEEQAFGEMEMDGEVWFDDGNIIIIAQDVGFRVHGGLLSRSSEIFRDMFMLPQPGSPNLLGSATNACPTVHVTDTSHDIRQLLKVIYGGPE